MSKNGHLSKRDWLAGAIEQFEAPLLRYAIHLTGNSECARDVVQDTFVRLCAEEPKQIHDHLAPWLYTVCRNRALDLIRKESRIMPLDELPREPAATDIASPDRALEERDQAEHALAMLDRLPKNQQEVVRLKFQHGLSYKEISAITHLTVTNVGFLLHTALKTLRRQFRNDCNPNFNV